jgi:hypothetical protein
VLGPPMSFSMRDAIVIDNAAKQVIAALSEFRTAGSEAHRLRWITLARQSTNLEC